MTPNNPRKHVKPGGYVLIVGAGGGSLSVDGSICAGGPPAKVVLAGVDETTKSAICKCGGCSAEVIEIGKLTPEAVKPLMQERTGAKGFDDIIVLGTLDPELIEALKTALAKDGTLKIAAI